LIKFSTRGILTLRYTVCMELLLFGTLAVLAMGHHVHRFQQKTRPQFPKPLHQSSDNK